MTEKRFTYNVNKNTIECNGEFVAYLNSVDGFRIVNKLNVLSTENKQLKQSMDKQRELYSNLRREKGALEEKLECLSEENEQLKQDGAYWGQTAEARKKEIDRLKQQLSRIDRLINDLGHDEMCRQYNEIIGNDSTNSGNDRRNDE